jgi:ABC-type transporter Mla maintaining outer membrane lipid asymmetry ATPase subunit MlaF/ABC-type transporter Mla maintaining outer membrane lipid asymmetry permease subunit MlaE
MIGVSDSWEKVISVGRMAQEPASLATTSSSDMSFREEQAASPSSLPPLVTVTVRRMGANCPFGNETVQFGVQRGGCVWLRGNSGRGKSTIAMTLANVAPLNASQLERRLDLHIECQWNEKIPPTERCGVLFQQTALLDELTVAGNLAVALQAATPRDHDQKTSAPTAADRNRQIKQLLSAVGLDYARDAAKRPTELSGGMARRAGLALQLAQKKQVVVLDEPFAGLDYDTAVSVAKELVHLRNTCRIGLVLISHEPDLAQLVLAESCRDNVIITLTEPLQVPPDDGVGQRLSQPNLFGTKWKDRFLERLVDYILYSLPLILLTFAAAGTAIAMLSADSLRRVDVIEPVLKIVDKEVRPMIKMLTNEEPSVFAMMGVHFKVKQMLNETVPPAKATLYAMGMAKLLVLEIGPLLTALLLCGRIGGSYAGRVAVLQSTSQTKLLYTLGVSTWHWSLTPSLMAALLAGPILTGVGTTLALTLAGWIGAAYGIGTVSDFWSTVQSNIVPALRLRGLAQYYNQREVPSIPTYSPLQLDYYLSTHSTLWTDTAIEILTYPIVYHVLKAVAFLTIIMVVAELCARSRPNLASRGVPGVITSAVVLAGLMVILADWAFSRLWLQRK